MRLQARVGAQLPPSRRGRDALCDNARRPGRRRRIALIKYRVRIADLDRHLFEIDCRIDDPIPEQRFTLPAWIPGSYLLREFARFVVGIEASSNGQAIPVEKTESSAWLVRGARTDLTLTMKVYALDQSVQAQASQVVGDLSRHELARL